MRRQTTRTPLERSIETSIRNAEVKKQSMTGFAWITAIAAISAGVTFQSIEIGIAILVAGSTLTAFWYRQS